MSRSDNAPANHEKPKYRSVVEGFALANDLATSRLKVSEFARLWSA